MEKIIDFLTLFEWSVKASERTGFDHDYWHNGITLIVGGIIVAVNTLFYLFEYRWSDILRQYEILSWQTRLVRPIALVYPILALFISIQFPLGWSWLVGALTLIGGLILMYGAETDCYEDLLNYHIKKDKYQYDLIKKQELYNTYLES